MAAGTGPIGTLKPTLPAQDAPATAEKVTPSADDTKAQAIKAQEKEDASLDESDLDILEEGKKIPYSRFKEVNDKAKLAQKALADREREFDVRLQREVELAEIRARAKVDKESADVNNYLTDEEREKAELKGELRRLKDELGGIRGEMSTQKTENKIKRLETEYPEADSLAVLGWARQLGPEADLDELMERSHNRNIERAQASVRTIIEKKKAKAKQAIPTGESGFRLKDSDKPKSLSEAHSLVRRIMGGG